MRNQTQCIHDQIAASSNEAGRTDQLNLICPLMSVFRPWVWWFRVFSCLVKSLDSHLWDFHFLSFSHDYSNELYALQWWKLQEAVHISASYWIQGKFAKYRFFHKSLGFFCHLGISLWVCCVICGAVGSFDDEISSSVSSLFDMLMSSDSLSLFDFSDIIWSTIEGFYKRLEISKSLILTWAKNECILDWFIAILNALNEQSTYLIDRRKRHVGTISKWTCLKWYLDYVIHLIFRRCAALSKSSIIPVILSHALDFKIP